MPPRIFISYRRSDNQTMTDRIHDWLRRGLGEGAIFKDIDNIPPGRDFRGVLREATAQCSVMLVVIGKGWVDATDKNGNRRLDNPNDFVRIEIETGLQRDGIVVIPLLIDGADMPSDTQLPDSLKELAYKNAFVIHRDPIFKHDMATLIRYLRSLLQGNGRLMRYVAAILALVVMIAALAIIVPPLITGANGTLTPTLTQAVIASTDAPTQPSDTGTSEPSATHTPTTRPSDTFTPTDPPSNTPAPTLTPTTQPSNTPVPTNIPTLAPTLDPYNAAWEQARRFTGTRNRDWEQFAYTFPDDPAAASMVLVPVGSFQMGSNDDESEQPIHTQTFTEPFWIDQTEVTRAQYRLCVEAGDCTETPYFRSSTRDTQPINNIDWFQARDYCAWRGENYRLPTEREWEYAARGVESWNYPWGNNDPTPILAVYNANETADVGSKPDGASWVGALDLSGNLWEWVNTIYGIDLNSDNDFTASGERLYPYPYSADDGRETNNEDSTNFRVLHGGSFFGTTDLRGANRYWFGPSFGFSGGGLRCLSSYNPEF